MNVGYKIKSLREAKNIARKKVAFELGMSEEGYAKIERNEVDLNTEKLLKISQIIDVPINKFFENECTVINNQDFKDNATGGNLIFNQFPEKYIEILHDLVESNKRENELLRNENARQKAEIDILKQYN